MYIELSKQLLEEYVKSSDDPKYIEGGKLAISYLESLQELGYLPEDGQKNVVLSQILFKTKTDQNDTLNQFLPEDYFRWDQKRRSQAFSELFKVLRQAKGYNTQAELAQKIGVNKATICYIESGKCKPPTIKKIHRLADGLDLTSDQEFKLIAMSGRLPQSVIENIQSGESDYHRFTRKKDPGK